jgi:hypothetical protein
LAKQSIEPAVSETSASRELALVTLSTNTTNKAKLTLTCFNRFLSFVSSFFSLAVICALGFLKAAAEGAALACGC